MKRYFVVLLVLVVAGTTLSVSQTGRESRQFRAQVRMPERMPDKLNLTDQQKEQMKKLRLDHQRAMIQTRSKIELARLDLRSLFDAEKLDRPAIEKKTKEISDIQHQMKMNMLDHQFAVYGILTAEQQKIWKAQMMEMGGEVRQRIMRRIGRGVDMGAGLPEEEDVLITVDEATPEEE